MSLAVLADHMASKGRGPDSMLIHMSPREVQGLQALAEHHGGTLTINPETGLPEANFLEKLLPTIIGAGISYFSGGTIDPMTAAAMVGGVETARTGDIGRGISAGFQAYGGANLTSNLSEMGSAAIGAESAASGLTMSPELLAEFGGDLERGISAKDLMLQQQVTDRMAAATPFEKLSYGAEAFKNNPLASLKANAMPIAGAFGPAILAEMGAKKNMPQTVTKPGMIAPYSFDPYSGTYTAATPYRAAGGGLMGMNNGGYDPGQLDFTQKSEPVVRMASGGIATLAGGGDAALAAYQAGNYGEASRLLGEAGMSAQDVVSKYGLNAAQAADVAKNLGYTGDMGGLQYAAAPPVVQAAAAPVVQATAAAPVTQAQTIQTAAAAPVYTQYTPEEIGSYLTTNPTADIAADIKTYNADPAAVNAYIASLASPFKGSTVDERGSGTFGIYNQMVAQGVDPNELYSATTANDPKYAGWTQDMIQEGYNLNKGMYALSDAKKGVVTDTDWAKLMVGAGTWDKPQYDANEMAQATGLSIREVQARFDLEKAKANPVVTCGTGFKLSADGKSCVADKVGVVECGAGYKLSADGKSCVVDTVVSTKETECPTGYHYDSTLKQCVKNTSATQNTTTDVTTPTSISTADASTLPVGVSGAGITTINPNGTITTRPNIPNIPDGGFTGMESLRNAYTYGGGSLGYIPYVPKTMAEFDTKYTSKLTGGSKQSYDYLTGKTPYSPTPSTPTGEIMKPYAESVLGIPTISSKKMYLFDPATKQYKINPDYAIPTRDPKTGKNTTSLTNKDVSEFVGTAPSYDALYNWMTTNNLSPEQVATASGKPFTEINKQFLKAQGLAGDDGKIDTAKLDEETAKDEKANFDYVAYLKANPDVQAELDAGKANFGTKDDPATAAYEHYLRYGKADGRKYTKKAAGGGLMNMAMARGGMSQQFDLGGYSDGGRLLRGPGDGVSDSIPATIGNKRPARLADGEFVVPARIVSELGNGSTEAGARKLYAMMDRVQKARRGTVGKGRVAKNSRSEKYLPA